MRISGGTHRGRKLRSPSGDVRPTPQRMREAFFQMVGDAVAAGGFLDIFAGGGSMGLEALSRGAPRAVFVEKDRGRVATIRCNLSDLDLGGRAEVRRADAFRAADGLAATDAGIVWLAPPYRMLSDDRMRGKLADLVAALLPLAAGPVAMQVPKRRGLGEDARFDGNRLRVYGSNALQFFEKAG